MNVNPYAIPAAAVLVLVYALIGMAGCDSRPPAIGDSSAEGLDDPERRRSETALLASLAHPSLVMLHDAVREPGTGREFLVMELVEGPNLHERLHAQGPLGADEAAAMAVELGEALHVIHARGIVHRDVKPANVLLAPDRKSVV